MEIKPPDSTNWLFDNSIYQNNKLTRKKNTYIKNKPSKYNDKIFDFYSDIMKNYQLELQTYILHLLTSQFGNNVDISDNTLIHLIYYNNNLIGIVCSEYDENIQRGLLENGWNKYADMNCVSKGVYLYNFVINPNYRGKGIGTILLNYLLDKFKNDGCKLVHLQVNINNKASIKLFEKNGFIKEVLNYSNKINYKKWLE